MQFLACAFVLISMSAPAMAADIDGTWTGTVAAPTGDVPVTFNFKADGAKVTGTTVGLDGATLPIKNGKIDGATIAFGVTMDFGGPFEMSYKGVVASDQIKMTTDIGGLPLEFVLKKSKAVAVDGTWTGTIAAPTGELPVSFSFKADGAKLTGTTLGLDGNPVPLKDGKIDGSAISFGVALDLGGIPLDMSYKGAVSADQIKLTGEVAGMPFDVVLKKSRP